MTVTTQPTLRTRGVHTTPITSKRRSAVRTPALISALTILLIAAFLLGVGRGAVPISLGEIFRILSRRAGLAIGESVDTQKSAVLWSIRLPRVVLAMTVGAALGVSGAALQGVFRNPLADPGLIGVSSGAAFGAVVTIVAGFSFLGIWTIPVMAFISALITSLLVFRVAHRNGRVEVVTLVLCGIAINALIGGGIGLLTSVASETELRDITFWQLGSVGGATWSLVWACLPFVIAAIVVLPTMADRLDLMALGEREAKHLGVSVERTRLIVIILAAMAVAASVAVAGILGFVGLIVPHLIRLINGPKHRVLLPASALGGAAVLVVADLVARTVAVPREVPLGVMTALIGAPLFLWLIRTSRQEAGGFA